MARSWVDLFEQIRQARRAGGLSIRNWPASRACTGAVRQTLLNLAGVEVRARR
jgi:hypothetical protein